MSQHLTAFTRAAISAAIFGFTAGASGTSLQSSPATPGIQGAPLFHIEISGHPYYIGQNLTLWFLVSVVNDSDIDRTFTAGLLDITGPAAKEIVLYSGDPIFVPSGAAVEAHIDLKVPPRAPSGIYNLKVSIEDDGILKDSEAFEVFVGDPSVRLVHVPQGDYDRGSPYQEKGRLADEEQHQVRLTQSIDMAATEITQGQYLAMMGTNPSIDQCIGCPVTHVTWFNAVEYCNRLSAHQGLPLAYDIQGDVVTPNKASDGYRLPTEAEWERACRAGTISAFYSGGCGFTGCDEPNLDGVAWYCGTVDSGDYVQPVGQLRPNGYGLYDMSGNAREWCADWYADYPLVINPPLHDPLGPPGGTTKVIRGGCFSNNAAGCRSAKRQSKWPDYFERTIGFRPVKDRD